MTYDPEKLKALFHYIVWKADDGWKLGATKLNKILWFSDARAYVLHSEAITGESYIRRQRGPMAQHYYGVRDNLAQSGLVQFRRYRFEGYQQDVFTTKDMPNLAVFTGDQRAIVDYFTNYVVNESTAASISEETHDYGWEIAKEGTVLPYFAILADRVRAPESEELEWARGVAAKRRLP